jgi:hypothetical protein
LHRNDQIRLRYGSSNRNLPSPRRLFFCEQLDDPAARTSVTLVRRFCEKASPVTSVTETIAVVEQKVAAPGFPRKGERVMSLAHSTNQTTDLKQRDYRFLRDYGFILALVCMALTIVIASAIFAPAPVGSEITSELTSIGP